MKIYYAWVFALAVSPGCVRRAPTAAPSAAAPPSGEAKSRFTSSATDVGCARVQRLICEGSGDSSKECESAKRTFALMPALSCSLNSDDEVALKTNLVRERQHCTELTSLLCSDLGQKTATCALVTKQTKTFPPDRCAMMLKRYSEVIAELRKLEASNQPLNLEQQQLLVNASRPGFGPANSKVVVVEFSDFQCPYCAKASLAIRQIRETYKSSVRFVFRQFPLSFHKDAHLAAEASLAANAQGKFWEFHDIAFGSYKMLTREDLERYAAQAGLDVERFKHDLDSHRFTADVDADIAVGNQVNVQGTPTLFINGARVPNVSDVKAVSEKINAALGSGNYL